MYLLMISTTLDDIPAYCADNPDQCEWFYRAIEKTGLQAFAEQCLIQLGRDTARVIRTSIVRVEPHKIEEVKRLDRLTIYSAKFGTPAY